MPATPGAVAGGLVLAGERGGSYEAGDADLPVAAGEVDGPVQPGPAVGDVDADQSVDERGDTDPDCDRLLGAVEVAVAGLAGLPVEGLGDGDLDGLLRRLRRPILQLEGVRARAAAVSQERALARRSGGASGPVVREHQRQLAQDQRLTPSEAKRRIDAGLAARDNAGTRAAMTEGDIGPGHAQRIAEVLAATPLERREAVEAQLLEMAGRMDGLAFSRAARRLLGEVRPEALARDERRQHLDRSFKATDTEDGGFAFSGLLYGLAAEDARNALNAFRRPDTPDEFRTPAQRGADAFQQLCAAALRIGEAPTTHGVRPQVGVVFTAEQYQALLQAPDTAVGLLAGSGNVASGSELRQLVADCALFRVVLDADGAPIEVSEQVRTVPVGLWRALVVRDGGCVWPGCDAPPSWCDVAHGNTAYADHGRLSPDNALLLCRRHHRRFDLSPYRVHIHGRHVTIHQRTTHTSPTGEPVMRWEPLPSHGPDTTDDQPPDPPPGGQPRAGPGGDGPGGAGPGSGSQGPAAQPDRDDDEATPPDQDDIVRPPPEQPGLWSP